MTDTRTLRTHTLAVPGATLCYDLRGELTDGPHPPLLLAGSPMDASGFPTLASSFTDRAVLTYDPRGTGRTSTDDPEGESTPQQHADDLYRLVTALGTGPIDLFGSSGGAVNGLALVAAHPTLIRTFVAHEPPTAQFLPDRDAVLAACDDIHATYRERGLGPAMAKFLTLVAHRGELPAGLLADPAPDPADFGLPTEDDGSRDDPMLGRNIRTCSRYEPDIPALRAAATRIVVAVGAESEGEIAHRGGVTVAAALGLEPARFPGGHDGFLGGEFGMHGEPEGFAAALRTALDG